MTYAALALVLVWFLWDARERKKEYRERLAERLRAAGTPTCCIACGKYVGSPFEIGPDERDGDPEAAW